MFRNFKGIISQCTLNSTFFNYRTRVILVNNSTQQLVLLAKVAQLIASRLDSMHQTRKMIKELKLNKGELSELPDKDYSSLPITFGTMLLMREQETETTENNDNTIN